MKKIKSFALLCAYVLGSIGGLGWTLYSRAYLIAVCVVILAAMAFPTAKREFKNLIDG